MLGYSYISNHRANISILYNTMILLIKISLQKFEEFKL